MRREGARKVMRGDVGEIREGEVGWIKGNDERVSRGN